MLLQHGHAGIFVYTWFFFVIISAIGYSLRRDKPLIKARPVTLTISQTTSGVIALFFLLCYYLFDVPCFLRVWGLNLSIIVWSSTTLVRNLYLYIQYRYNQNLLFKEGLAKQQAGFPLGAEGPVDEFGYPTDANNSKSKNSDSLHYT
ncbi:hypothetical protein BC830DRAFT_86705 [Chytriomyces sp. MP71]|nr:hypothetical protein BC830DRAFT_86705 [Chytriomyces sp. MP71]